MNEENKKPIDLIDFDANNYNDLIYKRISHLTKDLSQEHKNYIIYIANLFCIILFHRPLLECLIFHKVCEQNSYLIIKVPEYVISDWLKEKTYEGELVNIINEYVDICFKKRFWDMSFEDLINFCKSHFNGLYRYTKDNNFVSDIAIGMDAEALYNYLIDNCQPSK